MFWANGRRAGEDCCPHPRSGIAVLVAIAIRYHPLFNNQTLLKAAIVLAAAFGRASAIAA